MQAQQARVLQSQQTQTETGVQPIVSTTQLPKEASFFSGKSMTVQIKKNAFQLTLK